MKKSAIAIAVIVLQSLSIVALGFIVQDLRYKVNTCKIKEKTYKLIISDLKDTLKEVI